MESKRELLLNKTTPGANIFWQQLYQTIRKQLRVLWPVVPQYAQLRYRKRVRHSAGRLYCKFRDMMESIKRFKNGTTTLKALFVCGRRNRLYARSYAYYGP